MTETHQSSIRWAGAGLALSLVLIVIKLYGFFVTRSAAVLSDALESCVHLLTSSFALYAVWLSAQPGDRNHPYGHGKVEYLSAGLEGILIVFTGFGIVALGVHRLMVPIELPAVAFGAAVELLAAALAFVGGQSLMAAGRRNGSPTVSASGEHIRSDAFTSLAGFVGVGLVAVTGKQWIDPVVALGLGGFLIFTGAGVVRRAVGGLMDEANPALLARIAAVLARVREPGWIVPHAVKVHRLGQAVHIDLHVVFPRYWRLDQAHDASHLVVDALEVEFGKRSEAMIHAEPCNDGNCHFCDLSECPIRSAEFAGDIGFDGPSISRRHRPGSAAWLEREAGPPSPTRR